MVYQPGHDGFDHIRVQAHWPGSWDNFGTTYRLPRVRITKSVEPVLIPGIADRHCHTRFKTIPVSALTGEGIKELKKLLSESIV